GSWAGNAKVVPSPTQATITPSQIPLGSLPTPRSLSFSMSSPRDDIVTIRPAATSMTKQGLPNFFGVSGASAGSTGLAMNLVVIPPGGKANAHFHAGFETAIYLLKGR